MTLHNPPGCILTPSSSWWPMSTTQKPSKEQPQKHTTHFPQKNNPRNEEDAPHLGPRFSQGSKSGPGIARSGRRIQQARPGLAQSDATLAKNGRRPTSPTKHTNQENQENEEAQNKKHANTRANKETKKQRNKETNKQTNK